MQTIKSLEKVVSTKDEQITKLKATVKRLTAENEAIKGIVVVMADMMWVFLNIPGLVPNLEVPGQKKAKDGKTIK